jgi:UMF1 family MFS transporter
MLKNFTLQEKSWIYYDWANSAYSAIITAAVLPIFFKSMAKGAGLDPTLADTYWGYGTSFATLVIAILAPILGTIGDYRNMKMRLFKLFFIIGVASTAALTVTDQWQAILILYMITIIGFSGSNIFYDAFLVDVASEDRMDKVSTYGFALGYIGGSTIPFVAALGLILYGDKIGIPTKLATQLSFLMTAVWWVAFSIPMLKNVKQVYYIEPQSRPIIESFKRLAGTFRNIKQYKSIFLFLLAYFFYIDGVGTIIHMATVYGDSVGIDSNSMMIALLVIQIVAFPCSILFGRLAQRFGSHKMIMTGIVIYIVICILGYRMSTALDFWILALLVASSQGGIQALSRSYYGKMIPKEKANEFFGFYDIFGKFAAIIGPSLFATTGYLTGNSRYGVLSITALFIIGGITFFFTFPRRTVGKKMIAD